MATNAGPRRVRSQDIRGYAAGKKAMATPAVPRTQMMLARDSTPAKRASAPFCLLSVHDQGSTGLRVSTVASFHVGWHRHWAQARGPSAQLDGYFHRSWA